MPNDWGIWLSFTSGVIPIASKTLLHTLGRSWLWGREWKLWLVTWCPTLCYLFWKPPSRNRFNVVSSQTADKSNFGPLSVITVYITALINYVQFYFMTVQGLQALGTLTMVFSYEDSRVVRPSPSSRCIVMANLVAQSSPAWQRASFWGFWKDIDWHFHFLAALKTFWSVYGWEKNSLWEKKKILNHVALMKSEEEFWMKFHDRDWPLRSEVIKFHFQTYNSF